MSKVKPRHLYLAMKTFPLNRIDKSSAPTYSNRRRARALTDEEHNINLPYFFEYISSVMNNTSPSYWVRQQIRNTKRSLGYGDRLPHQSDEDDDGRSDIIMDSTTFNFVVPQPTKNKKYYEEMLMYRNKVRRLNYLRLKDSAGVRKTPKFIKQGKAYGIEIECYIPLSIIGVTTLENACPTCTSCAPGNRCTRQPNDFTDELNRFFNAKFEAMGIKNVQHTYDGSLDSNQEPASELRLYASTEFRVLCSEEDDFKNLNLLCQLLKRIGAKVDASCGLHVHFDQRHVPFTQYLTHVERLNNSLFALKQLVPKSRTTNDSYCSVTSFNLPVIDAYPDAEDIEYQMDDDDRITSGVENFINATVVGPNEGNSYDSFERTRNRNVIDLYREISVPTLKTKYIEMAKRLEANGLFLTPARYTAINTQCYFMTKTVEVRLHSGTVDYNKIYNWIQLLRKVIACSGLDSTSLAFQTLKSKAGGPTIADFLGLVGITSSTGLGEYWLRRWAKFNTENTNKQTQEWVVKVEDYERRLEREELSETSIAPLIAEAEDLDIVGAFCAEQLPTINFKAIETQATDGSQTQTLSNAGIVPRQMRMPRPQSRRRRNRLQQQAVDISRSYALERATEAPIQYTFIPTAQSAPVESMFTEAEIASIEADIESDFFGGEPPEGGTF
jgi:hypothetical protein